MHDMHQLHQHLHVPLNNERADVTHIVRTNQKPPLRVHIHYLEIQNTVSLQGGAHGPRSTVKILDCGAEACVQIGGKSKDHFYVPPLRI